jgi:hypothetical protein
MQRESMQAGVRGEGIGGRREGRQEVDDRGSKREDRNAVYHSIHRRFK